jgi:putative hydrolase of the HAD superfamily
MKFYRRLQPFQAISFDLDDTLYSNTPIMQATDIKMVSYFAQALLDKASASSNVFDHNFWWAFRQQALINTPTLINDVGALRLATYTLGLLSLGYNNAVARHKAEAALAYFVQQRSNFTVPDSIHQLLSRLKKSYPLIAISNGNVDTDRIGLSPYFKYCFHAGNVVNDGEKSIKLRQKPQTDMFHFACNKLGIEPRQLLHVGDCGISDIYGAINAGCQTAWISYYNVGKPLTVLPNIELSDVVELQRLL